MHPFVAGELALGKIANLETFLLQLGKLPQTILATADDALGFIVSRQLSGSGIGYVDAHLLVATALTPEAGLWTRDRKLRALAERLSLVAKAPD